MNCKHIICALFILVFFAPTSYPVFAQSPLSLAVIPYDSRQDLDTLFEHTTQVIDYLEGEEIHRSLFVALITDTQKEHLKHKGLRPEILDPDADISRYVYLYSIREDQASMLASLGDVFALTPHHTILKLPSDTPFTPDGVTGTFHILPFPSEIVNPTMRTKLSVLTSDGQSNIPMSSNLVVIALKAIVVFSSFITVFIASVFFWKKKEQLKKSA